MSHANDTSEFFHEGDDEGGTSESHGSLDSLVFVPLHGSRERMPLTLTQSPKTKRRDLRVWLARTSQDSPEAMPSSPLSPVHFAKSQSEHSTPSTPQASELLPTDPVNFLKQRSEPPLASAPSSPSGRTRQGFLSESRLLPWQTEQRSHSDPNELDPRARGESPQSPKLPPPPLYELPLPSSSSALPEPRRKLVGDSPVLPPSPLHLTEADRHTRVTPHSQSPQRLVAESPTSLKCRRNTPV
eukprot:m.286060 g.286060  ORF g.286060 m.286060 type:complete len:242 (+) comp54981_c0_seq2:230-955(+)